MSKIMLRNARGHLQEYDTVLSPIWCLLFGSLYWLSRRNYFHALQSFVFAIVTCGISHLIYPFFANKINMRAFEEGGSSW